MSRKKRILMHSEFSKLNSGYATYAHNLLKRMYNSGKYEIAEFAIYAEPNDPRIMEVPWKVYPVMPHPQDERYKNMYNSNPIAQFGLYKFEECVLDFQPDIVFSIFDYWYSSYIAKSPLREFFKFVWMPTVDSKPQRPCWIDTYSLCDEVLTYSYFGKSVLEEESREEIKVCGVASPGIDEQYEASDTKENIRKKLGIPQDVNIVTMVARNQMRKLIPDFLKGLKVFVEKYGKKNPELVNKTLFYIHTSNPDSGWDIGQAIVESENPQHVITTYTCKKCGAISISVYRGMVAECDGCKTKAMHMSSVGTGISRQALADIMAMSDIGVLLSIGEGFGMPIIEFKKVGVPVMTVPYSAMEEQCVDIKCGEDRHFGGIPVKVERMYTEHQTMQERALFDINDFATKLYKFLNQKQSKRDIVARQAQECADTIFTWDNCYRVWEKCFDNIDISDNIDWKIQVDRRIPNIDVEKIPEQIKKDPETFVKWCVDNFYRHPYFTEFRIKELVHCLIAGVDMIDHFNKRSFNSDNFFRMIDEMIAKHNHFENMRLGSLNLVENNNNNDNGVRVAII